MATRLCRALLSKPTVTKSLISSILSRSFSLLRPLSAAVISRELFQSTVRPFATQATTSSLDDQTPNWKQTMFPAGCDFEHWLVVMEDPEGDATRDEIIDSYIKTLAQVVDSEEEARRKIYSVSTRCYYAFGAILPEELSNKIKDLPRVIFVLPDSYLDVQNKEYGGEPFIDGKAVPYDPKYHEEWISNQRRAKERKPWKDRPRNNDRPRNFDRSSGNIANKDGEKQAVYSGLSGPPSPNYGSGGPPHPPPGGGPGGPPPPSQQHIVDGPRGPPPPNYGGMPGGPTQASELQYGRDATSGKLGWDASECGMDQQQSWKQAAPLPHWFQQRTNGIPRFSRKL